MERKNQNLEFSQKLNGKADECLEKRSHNYFSLKRPSCASGGDVASNSEHQHCNSKNSSYHDLSYKTDPSEGHYDEVDQTEDSSALHNIHSDLSNSLDRKLSYGRRQSKSGKYGEVGSKLKAELSKYKEELKEYNNTTKDLEEKYLKINFELNEMQQKHDRFVASRKCAANETETYSDSSSTGSEYSLKRKYTQVFHRGSSFMTMLPNDTNITALSQAKQSAENELNLIRKAKRKQPVPPPPSALADIGVRHNPHNPHLVHNSHGSHNTHNSHMTHCQPPIAPLKRHSKRAKPENKENEPPSMSTLGTLGVTNAHALARSQAAGLKDIYKVLKNVLDSNQKSQALNKGIDLKELQATIVNLQSEQAQYRNIIQQQQSCLHDYHSRCIKAQHIMQTQQIEIEKLNSNNQQLETEITAGIDQLRLKIDSKLRDVSHLPQMMREEQLKYEKVAKENTVLTDRLRALQSEASQLKLKMEELGRRKAMTINRLKAAERDLKIFKNYNTALKHEKRKLNEELQKVKEQLENVQNSSKRTVARQREQNEKQRRDLQKRVFELELKLSRSQNSTTSLIQERDSLIAELQTQLNTLVHNFEVSQKHIRVLRRHIYSMSGGNVHSNRILSETM